MSTSPRISALASRHLALGSTLDDWNGMGTAWSYDSDPCKEHDAVREAAGLFDMSGLKKVHVQGKDAGSVINDVITRDATRIDAGRSAYTSVLTDQGTVCDDAIVANLGNDNWLFVHGSGESMERLQESASGKDASVTFDDDLHDISLQGPGSTVLLASHTPSDIAGMAYFSHLETTLFGHPCRISRTGYSGERGYEIFAGADVVCDIWDKILAHGKNDGVMACSFTALDKVRIEAGLLFFGYDMTAEHTPWEVGLGFTISQKKGQFRGRDKVMEAKGKERFVLSGIVAEHDDAVPGGAILRVDGKDVGIVNSPVWSHRLGKSLALVHLRPDIAVAGKHLEVSSDDFSCPATIAELPFFDPQKSRVRG